mgnify:CR=1 FL=1
MRLFLAIDIPKEVKEKIYAKLSNLRINYRNFNWVPAENYHITLYFFGETNRSENIDRRIRRAVFDQEGFYLYSNSLDFFLRRRKMIIFLNFQRERKLESLVEKINKEFFSDFHQEKKYLPHLTLARCRLPSKQQYFLLKKKIKEIKINVFFPVKEIILFQSLLGGKKPVYKKISTVNLF